MTGAARTERSLAVADAAFDRGAYDEAIAAYRECLAASPEHSLARYNLATALMRTGQKAEAKALFQSLSGVAQAAYSLGRILQDEGAVEAAAESYRQALALTPDHDICRTRLGDCCLMLRRFEEAERQYLIVLERDPHSFVARNNLGIVLSALGRPEEAIVMLEQAVSLQPENSASLGDLGAALSRAGRSVEALEQYRKALACSPRSPAAWVNLGAALYDLGCFDDALGCAEQALALDPDFAAAHVNLGIIALLRGDYAAGWREYEWRRESGAAHAGGARWDGKTDPAGKTLLLIAEQGFGDTIQFVRFLPALLARKATLLLQAPMPLVDLLAHSFPDVPVFGLDEPEPEHDHHLPLMSLAGLLGVTPSTIPASPYLSVPAPEIERWRARLPARRPRVGIVWAGGARFSNDRKRSLPLAALGPILDLTNVDFVSLQKDIPAQDRAELDRRPRVLRLGEQVDHFRDTAAIMASLDLIISADTAAAHLAGALGSPVWILLPFVPDWRWLLDRSDSPWYPTATLFRQRSGETWESVVGRIGRALARWLDRGSAPREIDVTSL